VKLYHLAEQGQNDRREELIRKDSTMLRKSSQSIALGFAFCAIAAIGCSSSDSNTSPEDSSVPVVDPAVQNVRVTAATIDSLTENEFYKVDLSLEKLVYRFEYSDKAIPYDRIQLVTPKGEPMLLSTEMAMVEAGDYGNYPQPNLLGASDKQFSIAMNEANFGVLNEAQLDQLRDSGFFYEEQALDANVKPQSTDNCIHAVCEFCFENGTSDPPVTWETGTYHCYYEQHVWCD
jgi:hypothetical protein